MTSATEDKLLYLLKSRGALTAGDLAPLLSMTAAGAQQNLAKLAEKGLISHQDRPEGKGRPRRYWALTAAGHARFPDRHSDLTVDILRSMREVFGPDGLERLLAHREAESLAAYRANLAGADDLRSRLEALAAIRSREGYMARVESAADGTFLLIEDHCPVCAAAETCQGLCRAELRIFEHLLGGLATIERGEHLLSGGRRCTYRVIPAGTAQRTA